MTTATRPSQPSAGLVPLFAGVLRSEARKLGTVRSTFWILLAAVASNLVTAALLGFLLPGHLSAHQKATIDSVRVSLGGLHLSQVAVGLLGVLGVTSEYSSGMIRATLAAVPQRRLLLTAKTLVVTATAAAAGIAACLAAYLVFQAFLPARDAMRTTLADPGVLRAVTGAGLYLTVLALLGFGLGAVLRSSAGAIAVLFGVLFVPTLLVALLPSSWQDTLGPYLPMNAGDAICIVRPEAHMLQPWAGFGVFCLYAAAALAAGFVLIGRRDALPEGNAMLTAEAEIQTKHAARYLARLCGHAGKMGTAGHRRLSHARGDVPPEVRRVECSGTEGTVSLDCGQWTMRASPGLLAVRAEAANEDSLRRIQDLLTARLQRFGRRERLTVNWQDGRC